ncbi:MAG TPA: iron dependent repressor, metal binding and dimerization domain protein [Caproiciproducens sp.]|nr:iron dependent repressor, metal binding and dimerization domain protein [Caproiciproducens sp.]
MNEKDFYTFNEYMKKNDNSLTASMEDYLEMIYRLSLGTGFTRIHTLSEALNIQPSSATKMVQQLAHMGLVKYEKYGYIMLEDNGRETGARLLNRHKIVEDFIRMIGADDVRVLEETEKIEHMFSDDTIRCFQNFLNFMKNNPDIAERYEAFLKNDS